MKFKERVNVTIGKHLIREMDDLFIVSRKTRAGKVVWVASFDTEEDATEYVNWKEGK